MGIDIRPDGFCSLEQVMACPIIKKFQPTFADIKACVDDNDKKRYELLFEGVWLIRAVQGHSIKVVDNDALLKTITSEYLF